MSSIAEMKNEGRTDRIVRVLAGVALLSLVFVGPETPWGLIGLIPLATGALGVCPLYKMLGVRTCTDDETDAP